MPDSPHRAPDDDLDLELDLDDPVWEERQDTPTSPGTRAPLPQEAPGPSLTPLVAPTAEPALVTPRGVAIAGGIASLLALGVIGWLWWYPVTEADIVRWEQARAVEKLLAVVQETSPSAFRGNPDALRARAAVALVEVDANDALLALLSLDAPIQTAILEHLDAGQARALASPLVPVLAARQDEAAARVRDLLPQDVQERAFTDALRGAVPIIDAAPATTEAATALDAACWWTAHDTARATHCATWRDFVATSKAVASAQSKDLPAARTALEGVSSDLWLYGAPAALADPALSVVAPADRARVERDLADEKQALEVVEGARARVLHVTLWIHGAGGAPDLYEVSEPVFNRYSGWIPGRERFLLRATEHTFTTTGTASLWVHATDERLQVQTNAGPQYWRIIEEVAGAERWSAMIAESRGDVARLERQIAEWDQQTATVERNAGAAWAHALHRLRLAAADARDRAARDAFGATLTRAAAPDGPDAETARALLDGMIPSTVDASLVPPGDCRAELHWVADDTPFLRLVQTPDEAWMLATSTGDVHLHAATKATPLALSGGAAGDRAWSDHAGAWSGRTLMIRVRPPRPEEDLLPAATTPGTEFLTDEGGADTEPGTEREAPVEAPVGSEGDGTPEGTARFTEIAPTHDLDPLVAVDLWFANRADVVRTLAARLVHGC